MYVQYTALTCGSRLRNHCLDRSAESLLGGRTEVQNSPGDTMVTVWTTTPDDY